ncbi:MAG: phytanoyl-CoA dioxygenase family protein [Planctomycetes bacterium]|nr:phytanoyl-CoA dioxygenase family protein [Planctomycetota bacterium]
MAYKLSEEQITGYYRDGYIVFRQVVPVSLVRDLRREADKAADFAHKTDVNAQRLQPVDKHEGLLDLKPFREYAQLPELREALDQVLSPRHYTGNLNAMGILLSPTTMPWCTAWHRDMTLATSRLPVEEFVDIMLDWNSANQVNCPLYDDDCTWFVPGSNLRMRDMPGEVFAANNSPDKNWQPFGKVTDPVERERLCLNYTMGMPGAVQLRLNAGDFAMYRPIGWHTGNYTPYKKRATLHDAVFTPEYEAWWRQWIKGGSPRWTRKADLQPAAAAAPAVA